jgi:hypothetical protein
MLNRQQSNISSTAESGAAGGQSLIDLEAIGTGQEEVKNGICT